MKINFGSGSKHLEGFTNIDKKDCDLDNLPLPYKDKSVEEIHCNQVLEHVLTKPNEIMREFLRILKDDGKIVIGVPHFSWHNAYDEDHYRFFNCLSFTPIHKSNPEKDIYNTINRTVKIKFFKKYFFWNYLIEPLVNLSSRTQLIFEATFLHNLFPANHLIFEVTKQ